MEIFLGKQAVRQIRLSAAGAVEDGDTETLLEDVMDAFNDEQIAEIEQHIDSGDFFDFLGETLEEWSGDDADELFDLLETELADVGVELIFAKTDLDEEDDEEALDEDPRDYDDEDDDDEL